MTRRNLTTASEKLLKFIRFHSSLTTCTSAINESTFVKSNAHLFILRHKSSELRYFPLLLEKNISFFCRKKLKTNTVLNLKIAQLILTFVKLSLNFFYSCFFKRIIIMQFCFIEVHFFKVLKNYF